MKDAVTLTDDGFNNAGFWQRTVVKELVMTTLTVIRSPYPKVIEIGREAFDFIEDAPDEEVKSPMEMDEERDDHDHPIDRIVSFHVSHLESENHNLPCFEIEVVEDGLPVHVEAENRQEEHNRDPCVPHHQPEIADEGSDGSVDCKDARQRTGSG